MQPLQDLLHRIQWDPEFGRGTFAIGYEDRPVSPDPRHHHRHHGRKRHDRDESARDEHPERVVPFADVRLDAQHPGTFAVVDEGGTVVRVPLHRVRTVYRDGSVIWARGRHGQPAVESS
jgi:uncharacterized protein (UPF0248 family)